MENPAVTLAELRYLVAIADVQHFGRAAERCNISQPTLSGQLRRLEEALGVSLVERTTRFVRLTPLGERIVAHARRMLEEADHIAELARHRDGALTGDLRVGIIPTLGPYILPRFLGRLQQSFPHLRLVLREELADNLLAALEGYSLDVIMTSLSDHYDDVQVMPLFREPFRFVCVPEHRLGSRPVVTERDLAGEKLLLLDDGHCLRDQVLAVCGEQSHSRRPPSDAFRATSLETLCELVAAGLGCTLVPALAVPHLASRNERLAVRPLRVARAHRRIGLLWRPSFPRTEDLEVLGRFIQSALPDSVEPIRPKADAAARDRGGPVPRDAPPAPRRARRG